ncbi:hypothetical protein IKF15_01010 [Candidatus Saccharibacteria bacterium]|nr:hypothetical protein [Candidatus Saccharibacteria bacterium]
MKKIIKTSTQILTGIATFATLTAGRILSANAGATEGAAPVENAEGATEKASGSVESTIEAITNSENPAQAGAEAARANGMPAELLGSSGVFTQVTNTILYAVGIISVVMLIFGGFRYIVSGGDSKKVTDAKNTIMYAIIGLVIAILSYAIVNFVISAVGGTPQV